MLKLEQYDTQQSIDNDIADLIKIDNFNKHFDTLIMNIIQKYSLGYVRDADIENMLLRDIKNELNEEIKNIQQRKSFLEEEYNKKYCNPFEDFLGRSLGNIKKEIADLARFLYSLDCLLDISSTSEIFKEIVLTILNKKENFTLLELGSGSGILSLAGVIAAKRSGNENIKGVGFELGNKNIIHSDKIINQLHITRDKIFFLNRNIINPQTYEFLNYFESIDFVIAEIFSKHIPSFKYDSTNKKLLSNEQSIGEFNLKNTDSRNVDPLFEGLNLLNGFTNLFSNVEQGNIFLWPDVTKEHLNIQNSNSSLYLKTLGERVKLSEIGISFQDFETVSDHGTRRWE